MNKNKLLTYTLIITILGVTACKKQLQVGNPNQPTFTANVNNESGMISFVQGSTYINGFVTGLGWLGDSYFSLPYGYSEILADQVGADVANNEVQNLGVPLLVTLSNGTTIPGPNPQTSFIRSFNTRAATGASNNVTYYYWMPMYSLNQACNSILNVVDKIPYSGDATTKANTIKAWCYWWKGYAYSVIGSMYYSGLIIDSLGAPNNNYVLHDSIIAHSDSYFEKAIDILSSGIASQSDYTSLLGQIIPQSFQQNHGGVPTPAQWIKNANTMLARNILTSKLNPFVNGQLNSTIQKSSTATMTASDWQSVLNYATKGIQNGDVVFSGKSISVNSIFSALGGTAAVMTTGTNTNSAFKITERFIQNFKSRDKRFSTNFVTYPNLLDSVKTNGKYADTATLYYNTNYSTRWNMVDRSLWNNVQNGVYVYGAKGYGDLEAYMAGSYEENALMLAEGNIMTNNIDAGLAYVDAVRDYQGAGVAHVMGKGLTQPEAMQELVMERRVSLVFRGLSYYDSRRWGWIYDVSNGGGNYNANFYTSTGVLDTKALINYSFLDYWDVPADESVLNPPGTGSAVTVNPNF